MRARVRPTSIFLCACAAATGACFHDSYGLTLGTGTSSSTSAAAGTSAGPSSTSAPPGSTSTDPGSSTDPTTTTDPSGATSEASTSGASTGTAPIARCRPTPDLVACYDFDAPWPEGVLVDGSGMGLHGTMTDVAQASRLTGGAAQTSLASVIRATENAAFASEATWTQMVWIRPASLPDAALRWGLIDRAGDYGIFLHGTSGVQCKSGGQSLDSAYLPAQGVWTHLACVRDAAVLELRVNGAAVASITVNAFTPVAPGGLAIANDDPTPTLEQAFLGELDEVMLWRAALPLGTLCAEAGLSC